MLKKKEEHRQSLYQQITSISLAASPVNPTTKCCAPCHLCMSDFLILLFSGDLGMDAAGGSRCCKPRAVRRLAWQASDLQVAAFDWNAAAVHPKQNYYRRYRVTSWPASMMVWHGAWHRAPPS